jgi:hypothetical protein
MLYKNNLLIGMCLAGAMLNSCSRGEGGVSTPKTKKQVTTNLTTNYNGGVAVETFAVEAKVDCPSDISTQIITNTNPKIEVVDTEICTITINKFNLEENNFLTAAKVYNATNKLTITYNADNTVASNPTHSNYSKTDNSTKYINAIKTSNGPLSLILLDFENEEITILNSLTASEKVFGINNIPAPASPNLKINKFKIGTGESAKKIYTLSGPNNAWPAKCKIVSINETIKDSTGSTLSLTNIDSFETIDKVYKSNDSKNCNYIELGTRNNWLSRIANENYIILANGENGNYSYRLVTIPIINPIN